MGSVWDTLEDVGKGVLAVGTGGVSTLVPGLNPFDSVGKTKYQAQVPKISKKAFENPSNGGVRTTAVERTNAAPRVAPQATGAKIAYVDPAYAGQIASVAPVKAATIDPRFTAQGLSLLSSGFNSQAGAERTQGGNINGRLTAAANGDAPSAAQLQMQAGLQQGLRSNLALAASRRGSASGDILATRDALDANQQLAAQTAAQGGILRANEMATARAQLTDAINAKRSSDLQAGQLGLGLTQVGAQQAIAQGQLQNQAGIATADNATKIATTQGTLDTQAAIASADNATKIATTQAQLDDQVGIANLDAKLKQTGMDDQQRLAYFTALMGIDQNTMQGRMQYEQLKAQLGIQVQGINAGIAQGNAQAGKDLTIGLLNGVAGLGGTLAKGGA